MSSQIVQSPVETSHSKAQLKCFDYLQLAVGNAYQSMHLLRVLFGFSPRAYLGLETGEREKLSYVLTQGNINLLVTSAIEASAPLAAEVKVHGDAINDMALPWMMQQKRFIRPCWVGQALSLSQPHRRTSSGRSHLHQFGLP